MMMRSVLSRRLVAGGVGLSVAPRAMYATAAGGRTLVNVLDTVPQNHDNRDAVRVRGGAKGNFVVLPTPEQDRSSCSFNELRRHVNATACGMRDLGLSNAKMVVALGNTVEHIVAQLAAAKAGVTIVSVDPQASAEEVGQAVSSSGAAALLFSSTDSNVLSSARKSPTLKHVIHTGSEPADGVHLFRDVLVYGQLATKSLDAAAASIKPDAVFCVANGESLTHKAVMDKAAAAAKSWNVTHTDRVFCGAPVGSAAGITNTVASLLSDSVIVFSADSASALEDAKAEEATIYAGPQASFTKNDVPSVRVGL